MKVNLNQIQFVIVLLREIERQNVFLFADMIRDWQMNNKVFQPFFIYNNTQEALKQYIADNFDVEKFSSDDKYITVNDGTGQVVTFNNIEEYFDLKCMAEDIVENRLGQYYFGSLLD